MDRTEQPREYVGPRLAELCARLPPPPFPPWLEHSPERLHQLLNNRSSWRRFSELCPVHVPLEYQALMLQVGYSKHSNTTKLLPFVAAIAMGILMLSLVALTYFWHQRKQQTNPYKASFYNRKAISPSRDSLVPGRHHLPPSDTVETHLSYYARDEDTHDRRNPYSIYYNEGPWTSLTNLPNSRMSWVNPLQDCSEHANSQPPCPNNAGGGEILLQPDLLATGQFEAFYTPTSSLCEDNFYSTHSLPVDSVKQDQDTEQTPSTRNHNHVKRLQKSDQNFSLSSFFKLPGLPSLHSTKRTLNNSDSKISQSNKGKDRTNSCRQKHVAKKLQSDVNNLHWKVNALKIPNLPRPILDNRAVRAIRLSLNNVTSSTGSKRFLVKSTATQLSPTHNTETGVPGSPVAQDSGNANK